MARRVAEIINGLAENRLAEMMEAMEAEGEHVLNTLRERALVSAVVFEKQSLLALLRKEQGYEYQVEMIERMYEL